MASNVNCNISSSSDLSESHVSKTTRSSVTTAFNRTRQYTLEKFGKGDVTEFGPEYSEAASHVDEIKVFTERIVTDVGNLLLPTFSQRVEDFFMKRMSQPHSLHLPESSLGESLIRYGSLKASNENFSPFLNSCGEAHKAIGVSRKNFIEEANAYLVTPLKAFLDVDIKSALNERRKLSIIRLDLDVAKSQYRKCSKTDKLKSLEDLMNTHNDAYSRQYQITLQSYNKIIRSHNQHSEYFNRYVTSYQKYLSESLNQLQSISLISKAPTNTEFDNLPIDTPPPQFENAVLLASHYQTKIESCKAKVTCDYNASDLGEISVLVNELVAVISSDLDSAQDYVIVSKLNGQSGKVPKSYIEYI